MDQKKLSLLLKAVIIGVVLCALLVYAFIIPSYGKMLIVEGGPGFEKFYTPWLVVFWITALPVLAGMALAWIITSNIGKGRSFCMQNAKLLKAIAILAACDAGFFFIANAVMLLLNMNHPGYVLLSLLPCFAGAAICIICAALSHYTYKAALLQEQSDLTI